MKKTVLLAWVLMLSALHAGGAHAADAAANFPSKLIRIIVPYAPGGSTDLLARVLGEAVSKTFGQSVVVENLPGASGNIAVSQVLRQPADGHTVFLGTSAALAVNPHLYKEKSPYDPQKDLAPVILATKQASQVLVHPGVPVKTMQELTAYLKSRPGKENYATAGNGAPGHLGTEMYKTMTGIDMAHIPYKGGAPALAALAGGQTTLSMAILPESMALVNAGRLRALAITTLERSPQYPNLPTMHESGVPGFELISWYGFVVRADTPPEIVAKLNAAFDAALQDKAMNKRLTEMGFDVAGGKPEVLSNLMATESKKWGQVVIDAKVRID